MHGRLLELEHFRVLLEVRVAIALLKSHIGFAAPPKSLMCKAAVSAHMRGSLLSKTNPFFSSVCRRPQGQPASLIASVFSAMKGVMGPISYSVKSFYRYRKSDNMANVSAALKCVISLVVVFGILYVLVSPLPEVDATFSGKSALSYFILITHSLLGLFFFAFLVRFRPLEWIASAHGNFLNLLCVRLC